MGTIEFYDDKNLQGKTLIWNYDNNYESFDVENSYPGAETMHVQGCDLFSSRRQFWFNKLDTDIIRLYMLKERYL